MAFWRVGPLIMGLKIRQQHTGIKSVTNSNLLHLQHPSSTMIDKKYGNASPIIAMRSIIRQEQSY